MLRVALLLVVIVALPACGGDRSAPPPMVSGGEPGSPRKDLTPEQLAAFERGKVVFLAPLPTAGPLYNDLSCGACHEIPTLGGAGTLEHISYVGPGVHGSAVMPMFYRRQALAGATVPERPAGVSIRTAPPLYGLGVIEQIPDETIRAACGTGHPNSAKGQGNLPDNSIARFGVKPHVGTVIDFVGSALDVESSVTNPVEGDGSRDDDAFPDPEVDAAFVESLAAFVRGLAPPARAGTDAAGEAVFASLGCATCHVPDMPPAGGVYSDFCLHGMGPDLADGVVDHEAQGDEFRTKPLWGLRFRTRYLHDGRASSLDDAIAAHGGEAAAAANAFRAAPAEQRAALRRFLATL